MTDFATKKRIFPLWCSCSNMFDNAELQRKSGCNYWNNANFLRRNAPKAGITKLDYKAGWWSIESWDDSHFGLVRENKAICTILRKRRTFLHCRTGDTTRTYQQSPAPRRGAALRGCLGMRRNSHKWMMATLGDGSRRDHRVAKPSREEVDHAFRLSH